MDRPVSFSRPRKSRVLTTVMAVYLVYTLIPLVWLIINATKTQSALFTTSGLAFGGPFALFGNIAGTFTYDNGIFLRWLGNTLFYVVVGAGGATLLATAAGYGLAKYRFPGRKAVFAVVLGAVAVPGTALAVPTFLLFSKLGLTDTPLAIIIPSLISPFGLYLIWVYAADAVPDELLEAARIDGAGEIRIFLTVTVRQLVPGIVTVALFTMVSTWNNYFLPLIMLSDPKWYPLTVGLSQWSAQANGAGAKPIYNLVLTGSVITIVPLVIAFLLMQRFWQSGLSAGSVKQ
jgi:multiple sugar transport system permease protein